MKELFVIFFLIISIKILSQPYVIYNNDTINRTDSKKLKQGKWIYFNDTYKNKIAQEGEYKNSKKEGIWKVYYKNGTLKSEITYKENQPIGNIKTYYENGNPQEEGFWEKNRWLGEYKLYYDNGQLKYHWFFDQKGKRTGTQQYFHPNGKLQIEGKWIEGKETGKITEFYETGQIAKVSDFKNGILDGDVVEYYTDGQTKSKSVYNNGMIDVNQNYAYEHTPKKNENQNNTDSTTNQVIRKFTGTGYYKFLNAKGQIEREGTFENGILMDGKRYFYDENGNIIKTMIIKEGRIIKTVAGNPQ